LRNTIFFSFFEPTAVRVNRTVGAPVSGSTNAGDATATCGSAPSPLTSNLNEDASPAPSRTVAANAAAYF